VESGSLEGVIINVMSLPFFFPSWSTESDWSWSLVLISCGSQTIHFLPSQMALSCAWWFETHPVAAGENFPGITKALLSPSAAVTACWDLRLEHHWRGQFSHLPNKCRLNQQRVGWQGSTWCQRKPKSLHS
jgi:hypothetical protein